MIGVAGEFEGLELGNARLNQRAVKIAGRLAAEPAKSFPKVTEDDSELEALYRFLNNERVKPEAVLAGHYEATAERAAAAGQVLVIHDTTGFSFGGETRRNGLGRLKTASAHHRQGFYRHAALVASADTGIPLGLIGMSSVFRTGPSKVTKRADRMARLRKAPTRMTRLAQLDIVVTRASVRHPTYTGGKSRRVSTLPRAILHILLPKMPRSRSKLGMRNPVSC